WEAPEGCPPSLALRLIERGDARAVAARVSCDQEIAGDGAFAVAMLAPLGAMLAEAGAHAYRELHWECGLVGQTLYLEAEAEGLRATGIGCFFDEPAADAFGFMGS